jgi:hypothetical protein
LIGAAGGFVYTSDVCGTPASWACGAYGGWKLQLIDMGASTTSGHIAARVYVSMLSSGDDDIWLARKHKSGDSDYDPANPAANVSPNDKPPEYNTMQTNMYFQDRSDASFVPPTPDVGNNMYLGGNTIYGGSDQVLLQGTNKLAYGAIKGVAEIWVGGSSTDTALIVNGPASTPELPTNPNAYNCVSDSSLPTYNCNFISYTFGNAVVTGLLQARRFYAAEFIYNSSDRRLKTDIKKLDHALENVMKIEPVSFVLKKSGLPSLGVIAQDLKKVYPQLVIGSEGKGGSMAVNYNGLVAPLIGAVQELKAENDVLRKQIKKLETKIDNLATKKEK